jgi:arylsulfatase A-like enzyme
MSNRPNILFLMTDQMQGRVLAPDHPCQTPNFDNLAAAGVRFTRAYTPNAVCSPARASLMTGLLPHNHGVLTVTHTVDADQSELRADEPHWAQRLSAAGYRTGYFGKWHVERTYDLDRFGWQQSASEGSEPLRRLEGEAAERVNTGSFSLEMHLENPPGYERQRFYGVTDVPPERRRVGIRTELALEFLDGALAANEPWCCFVSVIEPHDPFICGEEAFALYDVDSIELAPNVHDDMSDRPGIYRKAARSWDGMTDRQHREAAACYYASISEIDQQFGRLIDRVKAAGQLEDTIIVLTSDHGELLGAHGLYCKNFTASEEIYNIPLILAGPGIRRGEVADARVGSHDLCPTLLELTGSDGIDSPDSRSFAEVLRDPWGAPADFQTGYAEYFGVRMALTQRVVWDGQWKFVFNGFDFDELYDLAADPYEMVNLASNPQYRDRLRWMTKQMWDVVTRTGDHSLLNSQYPILRVAPYGPLIEQEE